MSVAESLNSETFLSSSTLDDASRPTLGDDVKSLQNKQSSLAYNEDFHIVGDASIKNGAGAMRFLVSMALIICTIFVVNLSLMTFDYRDEISVTLIFIWILHLITLVFSARDWWKVWQLTDDSTRQLSWEWQHKAFKRMGYVTFFVWLLVFPTVLTFVLHSLVPSRYFWDMLFEAPRNFLLDIIWHIVTFGGMIFVSLWTLYLCHVTLKRGRFDQQVNGMLTERKNLKNLRKEARRVGEADRVAELTAELRELNRVPKEPWRVKAKAAAVFNLIAIGSFWWSLIDAYQYTENWGYVMTTVVYFLMSLPIILYAFENLMDTRHMKSWWIAFRATSAIHLLMAWICFWVTLTLLLFQYADNKGFWDTVDGLPAHKGNLVRWHMFLFMLYVFVIAGRTYYHKLRKEGRAPRVMIAEAAGQHHTDKNLYCCWGRIKKDWK